jgi:molybdopterin adenylyltransferase
MKRARVIVMSDGCFHGTREDKSGPLMVKKLKEAGFDVGEPVIVPDDPLHIEETLLRLADDEEIELVMTTGGTGLGPGDVTPEVMEKILDREIPGIPMALMIRGLASTPRAMLSRYRAGIRKKTLLINLPGSPGAVEEGMETILPVLDHALHIIEGGGHPH